ncbi:hypothetical protein ACIRPT_14200 [Streptomyces sp. NPDC101227]|uniref:hypothetical protein n=1 Tax=Streptomyces sp. NPDC101227 TaxID=3366136 RepID=UPI003818F10A
MAAPAKVTTSIAAAVALAAIAGCAGPLRGGPAPHTKKGRVAPHAPAQTLRLIGDGSTAYTGEQPNQPTPVRLEPGKRPPQFVVFSWDGAGEDGRRLFSHFRAVGKKYQATMTFFLSGVYLLPEDKRDLYAPPRHAPGTSAIGFNDVQGIKDTVTQIRGAWQEGHEIGTHFNGHFCGPRGAGVWTPAEWISEIEQAEEFVKRWKTNSGLTSERPLPFDYSRELVGGRAPCLEGQRNLLRAARAMGFRYDASSPGGRQTWPRKAGGIWDFPLQAIPLPGRRFETLSMDYNFLANQSGTTHGDRALHAAWGRQMLGGVMEGFKRAYHGNRAPLFIGDHFESWNGGTYMAAVEKAIKAICLRKGVRCVSFKQLADWLDAQQPDVLARLRGLRVGESPKGGWASYLADAAGPPGRAGVPDTAGGTPYATPYAPTGRPDGPVLPADADARSGPIRPIGPIRPAAE